MNAFFNYRVDLNSTLCDNVNIDKLIKSIRTLNKINKIFKLEKCSTSDVNDNQIYIFIENGFLTCNFSHNLIEFCYNNIILLSKLNYKNAYNFIFKKNKKTIKIAKTNFNKLSSKEIIQNVVDKLGIKKYCLVLNARKIYNEYENVLGNLVYISNPININEDIRSVVGNDEKNSLEKKLNSTVPNAFLINSYLNFVLPSYVKKLSLSSVLGNFMMIHPINNDEKYIVVHYYY